MEVLVVRLEKVVVKKVWNQKVVKACAKNAVDHIKFFLIMMAQGVRG